MQLARVQLLCPPLLLADRPQTRAEAILEATALGTREAHEDEDRRKQVQGAPGGGSTREGSRVGEPGRGGASQGLEWPSREGSQGHLDTFWTKQSQVDWSYKTRLSTVFFLKLHSFNTEELY